MTLPLPRRALYSRLRIKHRELLRNVCALKTLRKAAAASAMTQPAATKLIRELEDMLGRPLFVRDRRGMIPTLYGQAVLHHANILMADVGNMQQELELLAEGGTGMIRLGVVPSLSSQLLTDAIAHTLKLKPGIRFTVREGSTSKLLQDLAANDLDLAFARLLDSAALRELSVIDVYAESFAVVCSPKHVMARARNVTWKDLARLQWVMPPTGTPLRELVDSIFRHENVLAPMPAVEYSSFDKLRCLIAGTDFIGLIPASMAEASHDDGKLRIIGPRLTDFGPISLVRRKAAEAPPAVMFFTSVVKEMGRPLRE